MNNMYLVAIIGVLIIITAIPLVYGQIGLEPEPKPELDPNTPENSEFVCEVIVGGKWIQFAGEKGRCLLP